MNNKQAVKKILETKDVPKKRPFAEFLKFMTLEEQDRAYSIFLANGNYDSKKTFLNVFADDIFDIATGKPISISEAETPPTKQPLLTEEKRKELKPNYDAIIALTEARNVVLDILKTTSNSTDLLHFVSLTEEIITKLEMHHGKNSPKSS